MITFTEKENKIINIIRKLEKCRISDVAKETNLPHNNVDRSITSLLNKGYIKGKREGNILYYSINNIKEYMCGVNITKEITQIVIVDLSFKVQKIITIENDKNILVTISKALNECLKEVMRITKICITTSEELELTNDLIPFDLKEEMEERDISIEVLKPIEALIYITPDEKNINSIAYINSKGISFVTQIGQEKIFSSQHCNFTKKNTIKELKESKNISKTINILFNYLWFVGNNKITVYSSEIISKDILNEMFLRRLESNSLYGESYSYDLCMKNDYSKKIALGAAICGYYKSLEII